MEEKIINVEETELNPATDEDIAKAEEGGVKLTEEDLKFDVSLFNQDTNNKSNILKSIKEVSGIDISDAEMVQFIELINRVKTKQNAAVYPNLFAELPPSLKKSIVANLGGEYTGNDPLFMDYLAKELIQDVLGSSAFNTIIDEYNESVASVQNDLKSGKTLVSAQLDVTRDTMTKKYKELADKLREDGKTEAADYYDSLVVSYERAYGFKAIFEMIEARPSLVNRCYKETRFFNRYCRDFADKFCGENVLSSTDDKNKSMPTIRTLMAAYSSLCNIGIGDDFAKTICVMIYYAVHDFDTNKVQDMVELYLLIDAIYVIDKASLTGDSVEEIHKNICLISEKIAGMLNEKEARHNKPKKKSRK